MLAANPNITALTKSFEEAETEMAKLLVVDHERRIRKWLTDSLGKCGYEVVDDQRQLLLPVDDN